MPNVCILTDSSAQFTRKTFTGQDRVKVLGLSEAVSGAAGQAAFLARFERLARVYDTILVLAISSGLHPFALDAARAATQFGGTCTVRVMDSQNTGVGLALLVELAAELAENGRPLHEIEQAIREAMPRLYTLLCFSDSRALLEAGFLSPSQAVVAEMLGLHSIFMLDEGRLSPMLKVRSARHVIETLREFAEEFTPPRSVAIVRGVDCPLRSRALKEFVNDAFPETLFSEQLFNPALESLFGRESLGLVIYER